MTLDLIYTAFSVIALVSRLIEILNLKFKFLSVRADKINDCIFWFFIGAVLGFWLFGTGIVEVAQ